MTGVDNMTARRTTPSSGHDPNPPTVDDRLTETAEELITLAGMQILIGHANAAWAAGRGDEFLTMLTDTCAAFGIEPHDDALVQRLSAACTEPYDRYLLLVGLGLSTLREPRHAVALLAALHTPAGRRVVSATPHTAANDGPARPQRRRRSRAVTPHGGSQ